MAILASACDNEIDLFRPDQEKTYVVFGLLNSSDPLQQVKIRMTSVSSEAIEGISLDSAQFSAPRNLQVSIRELYEGRNTVFQMVPVLYQKDPGIFFNTRNDFYETSLDPVIDAEYKLEILNTGTGDSVTSLIVPVPQPKLGAPTWPWIRYNFSDTVNPFNIRFREVPRIFIYLVRFMIRYIEVYNDGDTLYQKASWVFRPRYVDDPPEYNPGRENLGNEHNRHMTRDYTYNVFDLLIPDRPDLNFRQLICFEVSVWGGDQNLRNYTEYGIKFQDNRRHYFNNITNGIGFFGSCSHSDCTGVLPDQYFLDSLPLKTRTARLKFKTSLLRLGHSPGPDHSGDYTTLVQEIRYDE